MKSNRQNVFKDFSRFFSFLRLIFLISIIVVLVLISYYTSYLEAHTSSVSLDRAVDHMYSIIKSHHVLYKKYVVERLESEQNLFASEQWQENKTLPLPYQIFDMSSELASYESLFSYTALSPWSLNESHLPNTEFKKKAMKIILETELPYKAYQVTEGKKYYSALYPDKAISPECIECHHRHPNHQKNYPNKVFKTGEIMGGILINIPL